METLEDLNADQLKEYTEQKLTDILSVLSDVALGDLTVEVPVTSEDIFGSVAMGVNVMVRGLRELEEQDEEKTNLLEKANQELEDFVYIVSHDLKAPLRAIMGFARFLKEDYYDHLDDQGKDYIERIVGGGERMEQLINDLLELSRIGRNRNPFVDVPSADIVRRAIEFIHPPDNVKITTSESMPVITCDEIRLQQVFTNLINNGIKYNDKSGKTIEISCLENSSDGFDEFIVCDNGIGIDPNHQNKIFKIFQRLHGKEDFGGGTGVGLNIVKKIIDQHGGEIWVQSTPGQGSCFHFTIRRRTQDNEENIFSQSREQ